MKAGQGVVQQLDGQVMDQGMEKSQPPACLFGLGFADYGGETFGIGDKGLGPPQGPCLIPAIISAASGGDDGWQLPAQGWVGQQFGADVVVKNPEVVHDPFRFWEHGGVEPLQDEVQVALIVCDLNQIGAVHMAGSVLAHGKDLAGKGELAGDGGRIGHGENPGEGRFSGTGNACELRYPPAIGNPAPWKRSRNRRGRGARFGPPWLR